LDRAGKCGYQIRKDFRNSGIRLDNISETPVSDKTILQKLRHQIK